MSQSRVNHFSALSIVCRWVESYRDENQRARKKPRLIPGLGSGRSVTAVRFHLALWSTSVKFAKAGRVCNPRCFFVQSPEFHLNVRSAR